MQPELKPFGRLNSGGTQFSGLSESGVPKQGAGHPLTPEQLESQKLASGRQVPTDEKWSSEGLRNKSTEPSLLGNRSQQKWDR